MRVAVVGAGVAGLACAGRLVEAGAGVEVFDKGRGPGGRLSTRRSADWQADIGAQYFTARDPGFREVVGRWEQAGLVAPWGASPVRLAERAAEREVDGEARWVGVPRMSALTRHLADAVGVEFGYRVATIEAADGGWQLCSDSGERRGPFDAIAVAIPAPQASTLLEPAAPGLAGEAGSVPMEGCWAAVLSVDAVEIPWEAAFVIDHPLRWIAHDGGKPGRDGGAIWVAHAGSEWSAPRLEQSAAATLPELVALFEDAIGMSSRVHGLLAHKWRYSQSPRPLASGCLFDSNTGIGACGDWCAGHRVEAAWLSGRELGGRILDTRP
jgi:predicted NAD/FAD-dependent oxidoreductase